ncbi:MAG: hypothetical protein PUA96_05270 [Bacteroidales bacterium]|nr:hypothetical protein [Bacteroidales bacterium]
MANQPKPRISREEVQRIIDERLEVILSKEAAAAQVNACDAGPSRKDGICSFFRRLAGLFRN